MSTDTATIQKWFDAHVDDDEILAVVSVSTAEEELPDDDADKEIAIKRIARRFRSGTRQSRMSVAEEAQELFERKVSWVSFVSKNEKAWPSDLRDAFKTVEKVRRDGPTGKES